MVGRSNIWLVMPIMALVLFACQSADRRPFQGDPLLAYKKPLTDLPKADERSVLLTYAEPKPPDLPHSVLVADAHSKQSDKESAVVQPMPEISPAEETPSLMPVPKAKARLEVFLT